MNLLLYIIVLFQLLSYDLRALPTPAKELHTHELTSDPKKDGSFVVRYIHTSEQLNVIESYSEVTGQQSLIDSSEKADENYQADELSEEEKIVLVNTTCAKLNAEINKTPTSQENRRLITIAKRLSADLLKFIPSLKTSPVPGCCLYEGGNYLANVVAIAEKQERVEAAIKHIKKTGGIDQKVYEYFQNTLRKLQQGHNVPLPDYFHATLAGLESIIKSRTIIQSTGGVTGPGTYISCNNEGEHGFGSYAFAIDESCLVDTVAIFRTGRTPQGNVYFSMWASVLMNIPITEDNIAFIDTSKNNIPYVRELLKESNLNIEVIDRQTSEAVLRIFDLVTKRRELPSFYWKKYESNDYLPKNMYPRSEQGTFRQFTFGT